MAYDAALRSAFMSLFASFGGIVRVRVRPDCHQSGYQNYRLTPDKRVSYRHTSKGIRAALNIHHNRHREQAEVEHTLTRKQLILTFTEA